MLRFTTIAMLTLLLTACQAEERLSTLDADTLLLRTYEVAPEAAGEIGDSIGYLLGSGELGRATVLGPNRIAVAAPASVQAGVEQLIASAGEALGDQSPRIRLEYWLVQARPAGEVTVDEDLSGIADALGELTPSVGPMRFERSDYVRHTLRSGAESNVGGRLLSGVAEAAARDDRIVGEFQLQAPGGKRVGTRIDLLTGETLVLAVVGEEARQAGPQDDREAGGRDRGGFAIFVVRAATF